MKLVTIGLDVSTSVTGICVVRNDVLPDDKGSNIVIIDHIELKGCDTIWDKADLIKSEFKSIIQRILADDPINVVSCVAVEAALMGFRPGMSSAATISTLQKFNGIVSYIARDVFHIDPKYIAAAHARKVCGVKLQKTSKCGKSGKQQVFEHMMSNDLSHVKWPAKKNGNPKDWAYDATDAYVIARAGSVL